MDMSPSYRWLLVTTSLSSSFQIRLRNLAARCARVLLGNSALLQEKAQGYPKRGAGKTGCALHPRSRVQRQRERRTRAYRFSGSSPAFPAQWFYSLFRALPGDRLSCHRRQCDARHHHQLDASTGASGPHDFAVRLSAVRQERLHVHRIPPHVRDDRETPLVWDGMARIKPVIWVGRKQKYF
jgi:hypothetical protein